MTVQELMEELRECNPDSRVIACVRDGDEVVKVNRTRCWAGTSGRR